SRDVAEQAEIIIRDSRTALHAHSAAITAALMERDLPRMLACYERFLNAVEVREEATWRREEMMIAGRTAEQFVRMAELMMLADGGQRYVEQSQLAFLADQAYSAEFWASEAGDDRTAEAARTLIAHFPQHQDRAAGVTRTAWRLPTPTVVQVESTNYCNLK